VQIILFPALSSKSNGPINHTLTLKIVLNLKYLVKGFDLTGYFNIPAIRSERSELLVEHPFWTRNSDG
jgi:hypothetical protein